MSDQETQTVAAPEGKALASSGGSTSYSVRIIKYTDWSIESKEHSRHQKRDDAEWMAKYLRLIKENMVEVWKVKETEMSNNGN